MCPQWQNAFSEFFDNIKLPPFYIISDPEQSFTLIEIYR